MICIQTIQLREKIGKNGTSNIKKKTMIKGGKQEEKVGIKRYIRMTLKLVAFSNLWRFEVCGIL